MVGKSLSSDMKLLRTEDMPFGLCLIPAAPEILVISTLIVMGIIKVLNSFTAAGKLTKDAYDQKVTERAQKAIQSPSQGDLSLAQDGELSET
jgi:hypothetical protein